MGGLGLFCGEAVIPSGTIVSQYMGWRMPFDLETHSDYSLRISPVHVLGDSSQQVPALGVGQFANDAGSVLNEDLNNLEAAIRKYVTDSACANVQYCLQDGVLVIRAIKDIAPHSEVL